MLTSIMEGAANITRDPEVASQRRLCFCPNLIQSAGRLNQPITRITNALTENAEFIGMRALLNRLLLRKIGIGLYFFNLQRVPMGMRGEQQQPLITIHRL